MYIGYPSSSVYPSQNIYPMSSLYDRLIFDRTQADVDYRNELKVKLINGIASASEIAEWDDARLKGAYNYNDLNRVGILLNFIKVEAENKGYSVSYPYTVKTDWTSTSLPTGTDIAQYIENIAVVKTVFARWIATPMPTEIKTIYDANAIEYILYQVKDILVGTEMSFRYSNEIYAGGGY